MEGGGGERKKEKKLERGNTNEARACLSTGINRSSETKRRRIATTAPFSKAAATLLSK